MADIRQNTFTSLPTQAPQEEQGPRSSSPYNTENIGGGGRNIVGDIAAGVLKPIVQTGVSLIDPFADAYNLIRGRSNEQGFAIKSKFLGGEDGYVYSFLDQTDRAVDKLSQKYRSGEISFAKGLLGSAAAGIEPAVDLGSLVYGGGVGKELLEQGGRTALKKIIAQSLKESLKRGGALAGTYDIIDQLKEAGDYNAMRTIGAVALGTALDIGITRGIPSLGMAIGKGGELTMKAIPAPIKEFASQTAKDIYRSKPAQLVSMAFGNKEGLLRRKFGEAGEAVASGLNKAFRRFDEGVGEFQRGLIDLGIIRPPQGMKGKFRPFLEKWKSQDFRFDVRDALGRTGKFADESSYKALLEQDPELKGIVEFFDKYRKDKGLLGQQLNLVENLEDIDTYFSRYTPHVELPKGSWKRLANATTDEERLAIYSANSDAVREMIEYGVTREGKWKSMLEGFKNYYDAMDISFGGKNIADEQNAYLQWAVKEGHASTIAEAKDRFMRDIDRGAQSLTPRISSFDYERQVPLPWNDPDPIRVMTKYLEDTNKRLAYAEQFGNEDEVLQQMVDKVRMSEGAGSAEDFVNIIRRVTGQNFKKNGMERAAAFFNNIETLKLVSSALLNVPQAVLYAIPTDFSAFGAGIRSLLSKRSMIESIERGVYLSDLARQTRAVRSIDQKLADSVMRYSGFGYLDMIVKSMGSGVADSWANKTLISLERKLGRELPAAEREALIRDFAKESAFKNKSLREAFKIQKESAKLFNEEFKGENFVAVAGKQGQARAYSEALDSLYKKELSRLESAKKTLEKSLSREGREFTSQEDEVKYLMDQLNEIRSSIDLYTGGEQRLPVGPEQEFSQRQVDEALAEAKKLLMESLNNRIEDLTTKFDEARAVGQLEGEAYSTYLADGKQRAAQIFEKIKKINLEIENAGKAQLRKKELLGKIADSYDIASTRMASENPDIVKYRLQKEARKAELGNTDLKKFREYHYLKELGLDPEEVLARGHLTKEDLATATQALVEQTQGSNNPLMTPLFAESPGGKIFYQFKKIVLQQMNFFGKQIKRNLASKETGSFGNATKFLTVAFLIYPPTTGVIRDVRNIIVGKTSPDKAFEFDKYWKDWNVLSATGLFLDFSKSFDAGREEEFFTPVAVSDAIKYTSALFDISRGTVTGEGDDVKRGFEAIYKQLVRQTGVGSIVQNYLEK